MESTSGNPSVMSTESLIMSLLGQIQSLESERDDARLVAARLHERLERTTRQNNNNLPTVKNSDAGIKTETGNSHRLAKIVKEVSSNMLNDLQQIVTNEEQRFYNLKELNAQGENDQTASFRVQLAVYKQHYEKLLDEAEREKLELRKKIKAQQDLLLDRDIKITELERKLGIVQR